MFSFNCNSWGVVLVLWNVYDITMDYRFKRGLRFRFGSKVFRPWNPGFEARAAQKVV